MEQKYELIRFTKKENLFFEFIKGNINQNNELLLTYDEIMKRLEISRTKLRKIIARFIAIGLLCKVKNNSTQTSPWKREALKFIKDDSNIMFLKNM